MKILRKLVILLLSTFCAVALSAPDAINPDDHPLQGYSETEGSFYNKRTYTQHADLHTVLLTHSDYYQTRHKIGDYDEIFMNKEIHAYDYAEQSGAMPKLSWKLYDFIHECPTSARLDFADDIPQITDIDGDGQKEIWLGYYKGCHGDVSPDELKVFMYLNGKKHSIRGRTHIFVDGHYSGGDYKEDSAMQNAKKVFRDYGIKLFLKLANEK
ncbi:MAG: hypothetical protein J6M93_06185 [Succinivibrio sp.]|nr:hypothetical protein [Succinivibrio sp.]